MVEPDGQTIKVDQIRQLQEEFSKSGFESRLKIFLLSQSEKMNTSAANSLLKFLEEPVGNFLAILYRRQYVACRLSGGQAFGRIPVPGLSTSTTC